MQSTENSKLKTIINRKQFIYEIQDISLPACFHTWYVCL